MSNIFVSKIKDVVKGNIVSNIISLSFLQMLNYLVPFLILPFIVRIIGTEKFGIVNFAQSFITYFTLLINYGFDFSASKKIAAVKSVEEVGQVFWTTFWAKSILFVVSSLLFLLTILLSGQLSKIALILLIAFLANVGFLFTPSWLYQGLRAMPKLSFITLIGKAIPLILLFLIIQDSSQFYLFPLAISAGQVGTGLFSFFYAIKKFGLPFKGPEIGPIKETLFESFPLFLSTMLINFYTSSNIVILGFLGSEYATGLFSASSKIVIISLFVVQVPLGQIFYPAVASSFRDSFSKGVELITRLFYVFGGVGFLMTLLLYLFGGVAIEILFGPEFIEAKNSLRVLSALPFLISLSNVFAVQGLLNIGKNKTFLLIVTMGSLICILLNYLLVKRYAELGTSWAWVLTEAFITLASSLALAMNKIKFWNIKSLKYVFSNV